jgi:hypothetical protein
MDHGWREAGEPDARRRHGGQVGNWGRGYPYGGSVDLATGTWSTLPNAPANAAESAGAHTDTTAEYTAASGWVLDTATGSWQ